MRFATADDTVVFTPRMRRTGTRVRLVMSPFDRERYDAAKADSPRNWRFGFMLEKDGHEEYYIAQAAPCSLDCYCDATLTRVTIPPKDAHD